MWQHLRFIFAIDEVAQLRDHGGHQVEIPEATGDTM